MNKVIISGGGTGGHVFPAISIAKSLQNEFPDLEILFVGALGKIEMEKVPAAGYKIVGLPVIGFQRKLSFQIFVFFFKLIKSLFLARKIIKDFKPDIAIGVGGFASGPVLYFANRLKVPTVIQEQNSYAGITNKILAKKALKICVAYPNMEAYFPKSKVVITGNPIRSDILSNDDPAQAYKFFKLNPQKKTILVIGGSLGARTINESVKKHLQEIKNSDIQLLWQCGAYYYDKLKPSVDEYQAENIILNKFINRMDYAYQVADIIISRAGAGTISELCVIGKPVILIPSPNVAEDHQTKNAMALVKNNAAIYIMDKEALEKVIPQAFSLLNNQDQILSLSNNIKKMAIPDAGERIVKQVKLLIK